MKLSIYQVYQVDAFTDQVFKVNPAAVCPLTEWLSDDLLLEIAAENDLPETAFYVPKGDKFEIRWFSPTAEVDLCGYATLATAFVLYRHEDYAKETIEFYSPRSGDLFITAQEDYLVLDFPIDDYRQVRLSDELLAITDKTPVAAYKGRTKYMLVFEKEDDIRHLKLNLSLTEQIEARGIILTAQETKHDFVSRLFVLPNRGDQNSAFVSANTMFSSFEEEQSNKKEYNAFQFSGRTDGVYSTLAKRRVKIAGRTVLYLKDEIYVVNELNLI